MANPTIRKTTETYIQIRYDYDIIYKSINTNTITILKSVYKKGLECMRIPADYQDGFKIKEKNLRNILTNLLGTIKPISENVIEEFNITYVDNKEVSRSDVDSILKEENGGKKTIQALAIKLVGNKNNSEIAHIYLEFAANPDKSIIYEIQSDDETWCSNTQAALEAAIYDVRKKSTFSKYLQKNNPIWRTMTYSIPFTLLPLSLIINAITEEFITPYFISSEYVFCWGETIEILEKRNEIKQMLFNVLIVGVVIALIISIIGGILANYITIYLLKWH